MAGAEYNLHQAQQQQLGNEEWSGHYFTDRIGIAHGYGSGYFNEKTLRTEYYVQKLKPKPNVIIEALEIKNEAFGNGGIGQTDKAGKIKKFLRDHGLGNFDDQQFKNTIGRQHFDDLSNRLKRAFANVNSVKLMPELDKLRLAYKGPHDADGHGNKEFNLGKNTMFDIEKLGTPIKVIDDGRTATQHPGTNYGNRPRNG